MPDTHRLACVPAADLAPLLGHVPAGWLAEVTALAVTDAAGRVVDGCVFADLITGLVVVRKPAPAAGEFPLRAENRRPPLTAEGGPL